MERTAMDIKIIIMKRMDHCKTMIATLNDWETDDWEEELGTLRSLFTIIESNDTLPALLKSKYLGGVK